MKRMSQIVLATSTASSVLFAGLSYAETVNTTAELLNNKPALAYVYSVPMLKTLYGLGVEEDKKFGLHLDCKSKYQVKPSGAIVLKPIEFSDGTQNPTQGVWMTRYQLERCGESKFYNALFFAEKSGASPIAKAFYPGSTDAGPVLVGDAMKSAVSEALALSGIKNCDRAYVFDMRVTKAAHDVVEDQKSFKGVWNETWTFSMCGQMANVAMTFIPDGNGGTTFTSGPVKSENTAVNP